ncbi:MULTISPECIES: hypothetical protein [unclassified Thioalkalivibrio]|uniref:hypothetical protein n=1 Tax=unclassified Thioalkalivibrio TaxID=2621013 RepID=UPI0012DC123A|nr:MULTISPECIES: hypothetical protein [unclassified Thioalkalivibrio]
MTYTDRLEDLRKIQKRPEPVLTEPTKDPFGRFVSPELRAAPENLHPESVKLAAGAVGIDPAILWSLLSPEDHMDLAAGLLTFEELLAYARSVVSRWKAGALLPDEKRLFPRTHSPRPKSRAKTTKERFNDDENLTC